MGTGDDILSGLLDDSDQRDAVVTKPIQVEDHPLVAEQVFTGATVLKNSGRFDVGPEPATEDLDIVQGDREPDGRKIG